MTKTNYQKVVEFNRTFGVTVHDAPQEDIFQSDPALVKLRDSLIHEEAQELREAINNKDLVEMVDAWADLEYVVHGAAASFGVDLDAHLDFSRLTSPETDKIVPLLDEKPDLVQEQLQRIDFWVNAMSKASKEEKLTKYVEALTEILYAVYKATRDFGINLDKAFTIVHDSNMSKSCATEEKAQETVTWYKENDDRYDTPNYRASDNPGLWVVYNESTGKVLKNVDYTPADLKYLLEN